MSPLTLAQLRKYAVTESTMLKLEFFFYTNDDHKAQHLAAALRQLGYEVEAGPSASDQRVLAITGWTTAMQMDEGAVIAWTGRMCRLGFEHDCDFDGWGTDPQQP
jgi:regulator of RNase E activity RraB